MSGRHPVSVPWHEVDTVLLDLDGTLLDLNFDNQVWNHRLPSLIAGRRAGDRREAEQWLRARLDAARGTLQWYCLDHWRRQLAVDVDALEVELAHLIRPHPGVTRVLAGLRASGRRTVLVTNAHPRSLARKLARTRLTHRFDRVITAHALGAAKEQAAFWQRLHAFTALEPRRTLLVDDNTAVLDAAAAHGIRHLLHARRPDSRRPPLPQGRYPGIVSWDELPAPA